VQPEIEQEKSQLTFSPRLDLAIQRATMAHRNQRRKSTDLPYIVHPVAVMNILGSVTDDEDILIAGLFHDILEDVPEEYPKEQMREEFGDRVVSIVEGITKDTSLPDWQDRADTYLAQIREADEASVLVSGADKIHNLMSVLTDYETQGEELWTNFHAGKDQQLWWYESVHGVLTERLPQSPLTDTLGGLVTELEVVIQE
jgi:(p)ppGpp synthase/HD superfamily hydrolase